MPDLIEPTASALPSARLIGAGVSPSTAKRDGRRGVVRRSRGQAKR